MTKQVSGFLGDAYPLLQPGGENQFALKANLAKRNDTWTEQAVDRLAELREKAKQR